MEHKGGAFRADPGGQYTRVDTTNFTNQTARVSEDMLLYRFTVENPKTWDKPWTVEVPWMKAEGPLYEYACTEGNESIGVFTFAPA